MLTLPFQCYISNIQQWDGHYSNVCSSSSLVIDSQGLSVSWVQGQSQWCGCWALKSSAFLGPVCPLGLVSLLILNLNSPGTQWKQLQYSHQDYQFIHGDFLQSACLIVCIDPKLSNRAKQLPDSKRIPPHKNHFRKVLASGSDAHGEGWSSLSSTDNWHSQSLIYQFRGIWHPHLAFAHTCMPVYTPKCTHIYESLFGVSSMMLPLG